ncbi:unnamed protein product, partial [Durusdinium trenchii]
IQGITSVISESEERKLQKILKDKKYAKSMKDKKGEESENVFIKANAYEDALQDGIKIQRKIELLGTDLQTNY